jgi:hypothetical protein
MNLRDPLSSELPAWFQRRGSEADCGARRRNEAGQDLTRDPLWQYQAWPVLLLARGHWEMEPAAEGWVQGVVNVQGV